MTENPKKYVLIQSQEATGGGETGEQVVWYLQTLENPEMVDRPLYVAQRNPNVFGTRLATGTMDYYAGGASYDHEEEMISRIREITGPTVIEHVRSDYNVSVTVLRAEPIVRNCTPHVVNIVVGDRMVAIPPEATPARVAFLPDIPAGSVDLGEGVRAPLMLTQLGTEVTGLPDASPGVVLIVSRQVVEACPERTDLVFVHRVERGADGQPTHARALARPAPKQEAGR